MCVLSGRERGDSSAGQAPCEQEEQDLQAVGTPKKNNHQVPWLLLALPGLSGVHLRVWRDVVTQDFEKKGCFLISLVLFFFFFKN